MVCAGHYVKGRVMQLDSPLLHVMDVTGIQSKDVNIDFFGTLVFSC